jgi:membrane fusion protein (multidrug efflux system)
VDDNNRVHRGDLLAQLDQEPFALEVAVAQAALDAAQADLAGGQAQVRGEEAQARSLRYNLQRSIEDVNNQVAILRSRIATLDAKKASLAKAEADYNRVAPVVKTGAVSKIEFDASKEALSVAHAQVEEALQAIYQVRVSLGLPPTPEAGAAFDAVPEDLDQNYSGVKEAQAKLMQAASRLGVPGSFNRTPKQMLSDFYGAIPRGTSTRSTIKY